MLAAKGPDRRLPIASTTKLMTAYLALKRLNPKQMLRAPRYNAEDAESLLGLRVGERMSVRDLLYALVLQSANDAAETLADGVSGSVPAFVAEMNAAAQSLGLTHTHYSTPVGLDKPGNYSSADDLVKLADTLLDNPLFAKIADSSTATLTTGDHPRRIGTRNLLLDDEALRDRRQDRPHPRCRLRPGRLGRGARHDADLGGARHPERGARDADTLTLLRYGFSQYKPSTPVSEGEPGRRARASTTAAASSSSTPPGRSRSRPAGGSGSRPASGARARSAVRSPRGSGSAASR